ncbi:type II toxin-antitoxin system PemK/MazF family toxin [Xenorhabdus nematophila]|uniref:Plasmid-related protein n=1 Tax=Xenorhabdus nematophila (strain ATCC 19061 / DSM 3370 / CCUG 14189 / LMG 1036 / NCIMB 9965 / AN6) TaxID=406817 RepID=D3VIQ6_XENNA|nr:type II toxin-antitoxin system PemK/MazF family toxin [Xenorhabdus nematophila]CEE94565.1 MazF-like protein (MazEF toxin-antitoxin system) [Xenorhabdus nematophila str. Anatoliense]CEF29698.1 MazF-like protein (MazEF toxin-antitoxin system) [Xenorhabdus nematophila str. Websteri]AYA41280.1 type II toxin-antitoxin system PemK/MazF family toxin [Xenorhabdus nematophila]KHD29852.1 growth inhibitor PemK [Xenorhabdus nematophila]MBA0020016.1 type II toxin-antitoxin system PemK/MazF family toxin 
MVSRRNVPGKGEIWHTNGNPVSGREFKGADYYLVISEFALNQKLGTALCVPITSGGGPARSEAITVYLDGSSTDAGKITGIALCYQIRSLDLNERKATYAAQAEPDIVDEILAKVIDILDPQLN